MEAPTGASLLVGGFLRFCCLITLSCMNGIALACVDEMLTTKLEAKAKVIMRPPRGVRGRGQARGVLQDESEAAELKTFVFNINTNALIEMSRIQYYSLALNCLVRTRGGRDQGRGHAEVHLQEEELAFVDDIPLDEVMRSLPRIRTRGGRGRGRGRGRGKAKVPRQQEQDAVFEDTHEDEVIAPTEEPVIQQPQKEVIAPTEEPVIQQPQEESNVDVVAEAGVGQKRSNMMMRLWMWVAWINEHFPTLHPVVDPEYSTLQVIFDPYKDRRQNVFEIAFYTGPIRAMSYVEPYLPDRVLRQFGLLQRIPANPIAPSFASRGQHKYDVVYEWNEGFWSSSDYHLVPEDKRERVPLGIPWACTEDYLPWLRVFSHPRVGRGPGRLRQGREAQVRAVLDVVQRALVDTGLGAVELREALKEVAAILRLTSLT
ncbi:hypothetical protein RHSIM_Rhsim10G0126300 [Rhododendron simsii]|uniref:Aminotransferase-like plant mobile domain-containing protein n=1 Tax=Rhododendron simsii TaxID=118357 RepID=A0A834G9A5_RHOSS|nr:hypothetical protein RHSIM_Rhsim10G0126300 [Rhododendron simsii]